MTNCSHWGFCDGREAEEGERDGSYALSCPTPEGISPPPTVILTGEGDVLLRRDEQAIPSSPCTIAIVVGKAHGALTPPQTAQLLRTWDAAIRKTAGNPDDITLLPVPHSWTFSKEDYVPLDAAGR